MGLLRSLHALAMTEENVPVCVQRTGRKVFRKRTTG